MSGICRNKARTFLVFAWMMVWCGSAAQETSPLFFLSGVPQASLENPARQNQPGKLIVGIPILSGIHMNWNSNMAFNYLFSDGFSYSFHRFYDALDENGKTQAGINMSVFFASLKHNNLTYSISVSEKGVANGNFDREIVRLIRDGLIDFYGTDQNLGSGFLQFRHYKELSFGVAAEFWEGLDIGIRPKLLFGKYFLDTNDFEVAVTTDTQNNDLLIGVEGEYFMSAPLSYDESFRANIIPGDYFFQARNLGFALDAGFVLQTDNGIEWSASLLDAGAIGFNHKAFDMNMARPFRYSEEKHYRSHTPETEHYVEPREALRHLSDSLSFFLQVEDSNKRMLSVLPMKINAAAKVYVSEKTSLGLANQFVYFKRQPVNIVSAFTNIKFGTSFELAGNVSLYNLNEIAPGIGAFYSARRTQFFLATNNILGFIYPTSAKHLNLSLGMNFIFDTE
ncbi:MAG: DUF5723 family protein [Bacteroidota bacterium]